jgi:phage head maturation protease
MPERPTLEIPVVRGLATSAAAELRAATTDSSDDGLGLLVVRFSTFNVWYRVSSFWEGDYMERTQPGAFADTIRDDREQMRILFDHGFDPTVGNKVLAPIRELREEADSPVGEGPLYDTGYNRDLLPGLRDNQYGSSMRMQVLGESWDEEPGPSDHNPLGLPERTITRVRVREFGPVTFPANPDATAELASAAVRSLTDHYYERLRHRDLAAFEVAVRAAQTLRPDFTGRPDQRMAGGGDAGDAGSGRRGRDPDSAARQAPEPGDQQMPSAAARARDRALRVRRIVQ